MKKNIAFLLAAAVAFSVAAKPVGETRTPASDGRITYVGRVLAEGDSVSFDWTGATVKIRFTGDYLALRLSDTDKNYYNLWIDRDADESADRIVEVRGTDTLIVLCDKAFLSERYGRKIPAVHTAVFQKRTEGEQGKTTVHEVVTKGELLQADGIKERVIEFVGDSYTCGYGSENSVASDPFTKETENVNKAYAAIVCRYFDADAIIVAHSGMGIARNYNSKFQGYCMPERYLNVFDDSLEKVPDAPAWSPEMSPAVPAMTVVYLGANDFSVSLQPSRTAFVSQYIKLLKEIKANYGEDHPILCVGTKNDPGIYEYVRAAVTSCGLKRVHCLGCTDALFDKTELGASHHPNYRAQIKTAYAIIPYISTLTGWEINEKPVK